jgi:hypothetical protein
MTVGNQRDLVWVLEVHVFIIRCFAIGFLVLFGNRNILGREEAK